MKDLIDDTTGATAVEYGLVIALIVVAMIVALQGVADATSDTWNKVDSQATDAMTNPA